MVQKLSSPVSKRASILQNEQLPQTTQRMMISTYSSGYQWIKHRNWIAWIFQSRGRSLEINCLCPYPRFLAISLPSANILSNSALYRFFLWVLIACPVSSNTKYSASFIQLLIYALFLGATRLSTSPVTIVTLGIVEEIVDRRAGVTWWVSAAHIWESVPTRVCGLVISSRRRNN